MNEPNVLTTILSACEANNSESHKVEGDKHPWFLSGADSYLPGWKKVKTAVFTAFAGIIFGEDSRINFFSGASDTFNVSPSEPGSFL